MEHFTLPEREKPRLERVRSETRAPEPGAGDAQAVAARPRTDALERRRSQQADAAHERNDRRAMERVEAGRRDAAHSGAGERRELDAGAADDAVRRNDAGESAGTDPSAKKDEPALDPSVDPSAAPSAVTLQTVAAIVPEAIPSLDTAEALGGMQPLAADAVQQAAAMAAANAAASAASSAEQANAVATAPLDGVAASTAATQAADISAAGASAATAGASSVVGAPAATPGEDPEAMQGAGSAPLRRGANAADDRGIGGKPQDPAPLESVGGAPKPADAGKDAAKDAAQPGDVDRAAEPGHGAGVSPQQQAKPSELAGAKYEHAPPPEAPLPQGSKPMPPSAVPVEIGLRTLQGLREFQIRLDPAELGRVDVRLEINDDKSVSARVVVDRVETLHLLQREAKTLERAFEQAGLKSSDSGIDISLRDPGQQARQGRNEEWAGEGQVSNRRSAAVIVEPAIASIHRTLHLGALDRSI